MNNAATTMAPTPELPPYTDENRSMLLIGTTAGFVSLTFIFVMLRVYVRAIMLKRWGADDWLIVVSFVLTFLTGVIFSICTRYGLSYHIWTVPVEVQQAGRRMVISATLGYHITFITIKMAFLLQFRRVFEVKCFRLFCDIMFTLICAFGIAVVVSSIVMSVPSWNGDTFAAERYDQCAWWIGTAVVHLVTDIVIFFMPIPLLRRLKLKKTQKAALMVSFGLGFGTTAISVVRITTITHVFTQDVTWNVIPSLVWSQIELCCALMCACIPTLRPLLRIGKGGGRTRWNRQTSEGSDNTRLTPRPLKAVTFESQHSIPSPGLEDVDPRAPVAPPVPSQYNSSRLTVRTDIRPDNRMEASPIMTAAESDDGSDGFGPVDVDGPVNLEVPTPLSPPPKSYSSPAKTASRPPPSHGG